MANGKFLLIPTGDYKDPVPDSASEAWGIKQGDSSIHPTWEQAVAASLQQSYGVPRQVKWLGKDYTLIELDLEFMRTEIEEKQPKLLGLLSIEPDYQILTLAEARRLLAGDDIFRK